FTRAGDVAEAVAKAPKDAQGVYLIPNRLDPQWCATRPVGWHSFGNGEGTAEKHVTHRRALMVDADPKRPSDTSANEAQRALSATLAARASDLLVSDGVDSESIARSDSGSGNQLWLGLDNLPADSATAELVGKILDGLAARL